MSRGLTPAALAEIAKPQVQPVVFFSAQFDSGTVWFWTGYGEIDWNGHVWIGSGDVIQFSGIDETALIEARGIQLQFAGADVALVTAALTEDIQGRRLRIFLGFIKASAETGIITDPTGGATITDPSTGDAITDPAAAMELVANPIGPFDYRMDTMQIEGTPDQSRITLTAEPYLASLERARVRRYTHDDQQIEFPSDLGLEFVPSIQNIELKWGRG